MIRETWTVVAMPLLERIAHGELDDPGATTATVMRDTSQDKEKHVTLCALIEDGYVTGAAVHNAMGRAEPIITVDVFRLTPKGRRAVGQWPSGETGDLLVRSLEAAMIRLPDGETRTKVSQLLAAAKDVGVEVLSTVVSNVISSAAGLP
jgi:hypothetical protein